jgi:hypothetical protein
MKRLSDPVSESSPASKSARVFLWVDWFGFGGVFRDWGIDVRDCKLVISNCKLNDGDRVGLVLWFGDGGGGGISPDRPSAKDR